MSQWPLLSLATFLPLVGAAFVLLTRGDNAEAVARNTRYVALWTSFVVLVVVLLIWAAFDTTTAEFSSSKGRRGFRRSALNFTSALTAFPFS